jgi:hypothetical protein
MIASSMLSLFTKDNVQDLEDSWLAPLAHQLIEAPGEVRVSKALKLSHFPLFSLACSLGFKKLTYNATTGGAGSGHFYWIDPTHASLIGQALAQAGNLHCFGIEFTTVANGQCWKTMADEAKSISVDELYVSHKSGDGETPETCAALAYLCTKLKVQLFHLWCADFEARSIDAFVKGLEELGNTTLHTVDICDVSQSPPDDEIRHTRLDKFVARNRK